MTSEVVLKIYENFITVKAKFDNDESENRGVRKRKNRVMRMERRMKN